MKRNYLFVVLCSAFVTLASTFYLLVPDPVPQTEKPEVVPAPQGEPLAHSKTYINSAKGFSLSYGGGMKVSEAYAYDNLQSGKSIPGVSFAFEPEYFRGTNLSSDSRVAVEWTDSTACTPKEFTDEPLRDIEMQSINSKVWSVASTSGAAAGNLYEEVLYTAKGSADCFNVRLFLHSSNIGNYAPGSVRAFDRISIDQLFKQMVSSFANNATKTVI